MANIEEKAKLLVAYGETMMEKAGRWQNDVIRDRMGHLSIARWRPSLSWEVKGI